MLSLCEGSSEGSLRHNTAVVTQSSQELFDSHSERKKTTLIQTAILLATWYVDLEDRDGMTHWIGIAISLSFTIGLHRYDDYSSVPPCPFPTSLRRLWKCIWWSIRFREIWTAMGFGRPLRINSEDCDVPLPTAHEVFGPDLDADTSEMRHFLPADLHNLALLWLNTLELSLLVESILLHYYRPRSPLQSVFVRSELEESINRCRAQLKTIGIANSPILSLHVSHVDSYHWYVFDQPFGTVSDQLDNSSALIALYRPYLAATHSPSEHSSEVSSEVLSRASKAAADIATVLNDLMAIDAIDVSPSMLYVLIL